MTNNITASLHPMLRWLVQPTPAWGRNELLLVAILTLTALALRIPYLNQGIWYDEVITLIRYARLPPLEIIQTFNSLNNHVLYSLLAHFNINTLGESTWTLRLPALIFGVATIPATYCLGRLLGSRQEAALATVFLVVAYHHVWFSQNARGYTGLMFGTLISSIIFLRLISTQRPSANLIIGYGVAVALTAWIHLTAIAVVTAHGVIWFLLAIHPVRGDFKTMLNRAAITLALSVVMIVVVYLPSMSDLYQEFVRVQAEAALAPALGMVQSSWLREELLEGARRTIPGGWPMVALLVLVLVVGAASFLRQGVLAIGLLLGPALALISAILIQNTFLFPRFVVSALPCLLLLGVRGGFVLSGFLLPMLSSRMIMSAGLIVALASATMVPAAWKPKQDFQSAIEFLNDYRLPGDVVGCTSNTHEVINKYMGVECVKIDTVSMLEDLEQGNRRILFMYSLPAHWRARKPLVAEKINGEYELVHTVKGSLRDGEITLMQKILHASNR